MVLSKPLLIRLSLFRSARKTFQKKSRLFCESTALHNPVRNMISEIRYLLNERTNCGLIYRHCKIILITSPIAVRLADTLPFSLCLPLCFTNFE